MYNLGPIWLFSFVLSKSRRFDRYIIDVSHPFTDLGKLTLEDQYANIHSCLQFCTGGILSETSCTHEHVIYLSEKRSPPRPAASVRRIAIKVIYQLPTYRRL